MLSDRLVAHRGYPARYPENTLLGFTQAIKAGAHFIETDILFSADHQPVLYHDALMNRISGENNAVHLLSLSDLIQCAASEPERLGDQFIDQKITPLSELVELLSLHPNVTAFIELKRSALHIEGMENAFNIVTKMLQPVLSQCILISFSDEFIQYAWQKNYPRLGLVLKDWSDLEGEIFSQIKPEYLFCNTEIIPDNTMLDPIESKMVVYEITNPDHAIHWFNRGADMVETFDYGGMMKNLSLRTL